MAKMKGAIEVNTERCKGCGLCIIACPQKVIALANKVNLHGYPYVEAVKGNATLLAAGNADIKDEDPYFDNSHHVWQGRALAVVRHTGKQGKAALTVTAKGLPTSRLVLKN